MEVFMAHDKNENGLIDDDEAVNFIQEACLKLHEGEVDPAEVTPLQD